MASDLDGMPGRIPVEERLNVFALVIYIPGPLGQFLDDLRRELDPHSDPHAHISVLPPRPLAVSWREASAEAEALAGLWAPFEVELTTVAVFPLTGVVYIEIGEGAGELRRMHAALNTTALTFDEPFAYHPHITLAQELPMGSVPEVRELAGRRWKEFTGKRTFCADRAVFVQNTLSDCWIDLAEYLLGPKVAK